MRILFATLTVWLVAIGVFAADLGKAACPCTTMKLDNTWVLRFDDEFNEPVLDSSAWRTQFPWGRVNNPDGEVQYYAPDAFELNGDGILRIKADRRPMEGLNYTSGVLTTFETFSMTFGYAEMKAKLPRGKGFWPAFWLIPVDQSWPPEIDVFEGRGDRPNRISMTNHWSAQGKHKFAMQFFVGPDFTEGFHTFGMKWQSDEIIWYVDGVERFRSDQGVPSQPMYLVVNLAVGGNQIGYPDESTPFPSYLDVDYVRVYEKVPPESSDLPGFLQVGRQKTSEWTR